MRRTPIRFAVIALLLVAWIAPSVTGSAGLGAQDDAAKKEKRKEKKKGGGKKGKKKQEVPPEVAAMLAAAAPGEEHKLLKQMVGRWDIASKFWMAPDAPPMESKGSSSIKLVLGGRFVQQDYRGAFMGIKFQGIGLTGYDKHKKKFVNVWLDTGSTPARR